MLAQAWDILSQSRCCSAGWQGTGGVTALRWVPVCPSEARARSEHREKVAFWDSNGSHKQQASALGGCSPVLWLRGGHSALVQLCSFTGYFRVFVPRAVRFMAASSHPCVIIWGLGLVGKSSWELCRTGAFVRNMHHVCMGKAIRAEAGKVPSVKRQKKKPDTGGLMDRKSPYNPVAPDT